MALPGLTGGGNGTSTKGPGKGSIIAAGSATAAGAGSARASRVTDQGDFFAGAISSARQSATDCGRRAISSCRA